MIIHYYKPTYKNYIVAAFPMQNVDTQLEMRKWCTQTFGPAGYLIDKDIVRWTDEIGFGEIRFNKDSDLAMFLLRWE